MAVNPFFLHGSESEQRLIQQLVNEQLSMYGIDVSYIPQTFVRKETILEEVSSSQFTDQFTIEAYLGNYDGYSGSGDILSKFGMQLKDEVTLIISKERFEDFISPFLLSSGQDVYHRPREGDLIYFPLGRRLFEIKFVEHEQPFYQLGKTYVYELKCELFEYSDRSIIDTTVDSIDETLEDFGIIKTLELYTSGVGATASSVLNSSSGYVSTINLINDGYNYSTSPSILIDSPPSGGVQATAVAISSCVNNNCSVRNVYITNSGAGYTSIPNVLISDTTGIGATATAEINTSYSGIGTITVYGGSGYTSAPNVVFDAPASGTRATGIAIIDASGSVSSIYISNSGDGYTSAPGITIDAPSTITGSGTFIFNEVLTGETSGTTSRVKSWDPTNSILEVKSVSGDYLVGEVLKGATSGARYTLGKFNDPVYEDKYEQNDEIQTASTSILDFTETNLFGNY